LQAELERNGGIFRKKGRTKGGNNISSRAKTKKKNKWEWVVVQKLSLQTKDASLKKKEKKEGGLPLGPRGKGTLLHLRPVANTTAEEGVWKESKAASHRKVRQRRGSRPASGHGKRSGEKASGSRLRATLNQSFFQQERGLPLKTGLLTRGGKKGW